MKVLLFPLPARERAPEGPRTSRRPRQRRRAAPLWAMPQGRIPVTAKRNEEPKPRSIVLPTYVWEALDQDAGRCRRSATKQIEAILVRYYNLEPNVELNEPALDAVSEVVSHKPRSKAAR